MSFYQLTKLLLTIALVTGLGEPSSILVHLLAGIGVGLIESLILTPFEVVKISIMSDQLRIEKVYRGEWDCWQKIYRSEGVRGFYRGYVATSYRQVVFSSVYFVVYQWLRPVLLLRFLGWNQACYFISGLCAGILGSVANNPFDVVKTRVQNDAFVNPVNYTQSSSTSTMRTVVAPLRSLRNIYQVEG